MLDGGLDPTYRAVLAGPHEMVVRVEIWDGDTRLIDDLPYLGGSVNASLTNRVTRNLNLTLPEDLYPYDDDDPLSPAGNEIHVYRGVRYGNDLEVVFPVFKGKIESVEMSGEGTAELEAADYAQLIEDAEFVRPYNSSVGVGVYQQFQELVLDAVPGAAFGPSDDFWQPMPALTWETDRGAALDEVGATAGAFWYALADGRYVLRRVPWTVAGAPALTLTDGPGGIIHDALPRKTREGVYNSVTAVGERTDGTDPVYGVAEDIYPGSPTYVNGKFGRKHKLLRVQAASSQQAAVSAARAYLRRAKALAFTWSWSQVPDPAMELGEVVGLAVRGRTGIIQVVSGFNIPLDVNQQMNVTARAQVVGASADD